MADRQRNIALIVVNIYIGAIQTNAGKSKGKRDWKCSKVNQYMSQEASCTQSSLLNIVTLAQMQKIVKFCNRNPLYRGSENWELVPETNKCLIDKDTTINNKNLLKRKSVGLLP